MVKENKNVIGGKSLGQIDEGKDKSSLSWAELHFLNVFLDTNFKLDEYTLNVLKKRLIDKIRGNEGIFLKENTNETHANIFQRVLGNDFLPILESSIKGNYLIYFKDFDKLYQNVFDKIQNDDNTSNTTKGDKNILKSIQELTLEKYPDLFFYYFSKSLAQFVGVENVIRYITSMENDGKENIKNESTLTLKKAYDNYIQSKETILNVLSNINIKD
ncbi:MAG: hypothetical protein K9L98_00540 [Candidatus Pacebacteria bacterium]|nr:hypothetical protein [Candidatus Paceibacterota bacterium]MCF7862486.1 hypothetical protein [Candidatus Paceibacterota bacterium]